MADMIQKLATHRGTVGVSRQIAKLASQLAKVNVELARQGELQERGEDDEVLWWTEETDSLHRQLSDALKLRDEIIAQKSNSGGWWTTYQTDEHDNLHIVEKWSDNDDDDVIIATFSGK